ncbi:MAG: glycosyltransferase family 4 protein [Cyclobacteriaceae bacterium]|nr:glycosyltransferase family 4 protein [Cyclobacteriaceae bacterium]MDH5247440.1 glycosyltransferase family 4 protein [Cyclobacteriaceae bacterium]
MPRFAMMLTDGMSKRGHKVDMWSPKARFFKLHASPVLQKWLGYIDQYIIFPLEIKRNSKRCSPDTLFVFTDQALGPWVPLLANRPHAIHCHDFMALRSALGEIPENPTSWTGRLYQQLIRRGFSKGKHFISVSKKTREDLHRYLFTDPLSSEVVYNGFHQPFFYHDQTVAKGLFGKRIDLDLTAGYILHVGGNPWYKNRAGVIDIYTVWRAQGDSKLPLIMIGEAPTKELLMKQTQSKFSKDIHWLNDIEDEFVRLAYSGADVFLFPSLGEGFGWPIAEAMASGCPVITTGEAPMTEVAGDAAFLIPRRPNSPSEVDAWAGDAAATINRILSLSSTARKAIVDAGINNAKRFDTQNALNQIEKIYLKITNS